MPRITQTTAGKAVHAVATTRQPIIVAKGTNLNSQGLPKASVPAIKSRLQRMPR